MAKKEKKPIEANALNVERAGNIRFLTLIIFSVIVACATSTKTVQTQKQRRTSIFVNSSLVSAAVTGAVVGSMFLTNCQQNGPIVGEGSLDPNTQLPCLDDTTLGVSLGVIAVMLPTVIILRAISKKETNSNPKNRGGYYYGINFGKTRFNGVNHKDFIRHCFEGDDYDLKRNDRDSPSDSCSTVINSMGNRLTTTEKMIVLKKSCDYGSPSGCEDYMKLFRYSKSSISDSDAISATKYIIDLCLGDISYEKELTSVAKNDAKFKDFLERTGGERSSYNTNRETSYTLKEWDHMCYNVGETIAEEENLINATKKIYITGCYKFDDYNSCEKLSNYGINVDLNDAKNREDLREKKRQSDAELLVSNETEFVQNERAEREARQQSVDNLINGIYEVSKAISQPNPPVPTLNLSGQPATTTPPTRPPGSIVCGDGTFVTPPVSSSGSGCNGQSACGMSAKGDPGPDPCAGHGGSR